MSVVIVGAGQAGFQAAASLRGEGYDGAITLLGDEPHLPYQRPPLSKGFLIGKQELDSATLRPAKFYHDQRIDLLTGERAARIDRDARQVVLQSGGKIPFDHLVLATGARVRRLADSAALYLRGRDDAAQLKDRLDAAANVLVIGGGFIGLEVAAAARIAGKEVTVVETQPRLMSRGVAPLVSDFFRELHARHGVRILLGASETPAAADLVVAGIGVMPEVDLALEAGLPVADGIVVDDRLRTSDARIFAIGDCAAHRSRRLESVQNAVDQARCAAANIVGRDEPYRAIPWFWTDQFDAKLQMAGLSGGADTVVRRGDEAKFSVFYFGAGRLIAVDSINRPGDHMLARKLLAAAAALTPAQAADESFDLKTLL